MVQQAITKPYPGQDSNFSNCLASKLNLNPVSELWAFRKPPEVAMVPKLKSV